jgi:hypothetical protein
MGALRKELKESSRQQYYLLDGIMTLVTLSMSPKHHIGKETLP